jgi:ankyrin repeat protein
MLERSAASFVSQRACVSCHHHILPILAFRMAAQRGVSVDESTLKAVEEKTFRQLEGPRALDDAIEAATLSDPTPDDSFLLMAAHAAGRPRDLVTAVYARRLLSWQRDGHWITSDFRPPHSSSVYTASASAVRAIRLYLPEELSAQRDAAMVRACEWLSGTHPESTEDASFRLLGLVWAGASRAETEQAQRDLLAFQQAGGGWPQLAHYAPDAYSTGEALFALHEAGMAVDNPPWRKGLQFLLATQAPDGTWRARTRMLSPALVSPAYFTTGFPYEKDEYLSYVASCWAVMALLEALPQTLPPWAAPEPVRPKAQDTPAWARTALFGTAQQLASLLDTGVDPNTKTGNGTTLLMMTVPDAAKLRLLLARGADAKVRTTSGRDALTIAAAYRDTARALQALLEAGTEVRMPRGMRLRASPLVLASMTGDPANVKLLLAAGADPSAAAGANTPLTAALTFGYADVARTLIAAGASAHITESTGINLLHWAAITNRHAVVPLLAEAGVPLDAVDENGFTPLMYAATIDFGDTRVLQSLLRAGANPHIRNNEGRTPLEQARHFGHPQFEAVLRRYAR